MNLINITINMRKVKEICLLLLFFSTINATSVAQTKSFVPVNGMKIGPNYIAFEAEATQSTLGKWQIITPDDSRYQDKISNPPINETHLEFTGNNPSVGDPNSPLKYTFQCPKTGKYRLGARLFQRLEGLPEDKCNDVYIKMAGNFTSGNNIPTNELRHDTKFYGRGVNKWGALYSLESHSQGHAPALYNLTEGEIYILTVSGRAQRTNIDYWLLYETSLPITLGPNKDLAAVNNAKYRPQILNSKTFDAVNMDFKGIEGFSDAQRANKAGVEILQNPNRSEWAAAQYIYRGSAGNAKFILKTMLEKGGESSYRLKINGELIGELTNERIHDTDIENYTTRSYIINNESVSLKDKDTIQIEFNNTSNGLVAEGDSTATAHGTWVSMEIRTTGQFTEIIKIQHPVIWATDNDKPKIMELIEQYDWAQSIVSQMHDEVDGKLVTHQSNPDAILNTIPEFPADDSNPESFASPFARDHKKVLLTASYSGMLYYLTEDEKYAQFAADILAYYIDVIATRTPQTTTISGNYFYDPRTTYNHFAIAYDFTYNFLKKPETNVYDKASETYVAFDNEKAQKAISNIVGNALAEYGGDDTHGKFISNHPVLTSPGALFPILCIDDDIERERLFNVFWNKGTKRQNSFKNTILPMFGDQGVWPESTSYSFMPNISLILNVVDRMKPEMNVASNNQNIFDGNFLFSNLRYPDRTFVRYGDSKRRTDATAENYRYSLDIAERRGFEDLKQKAQVALKQNYKADGGYNPQLPSGTFEDYSSLELFWGHPLPETEIGDIEYKPTVIVKHAGIALQRNFVDSVNSKYGLCGIIGGAHYVHAHCTGITMELYGAGYVMAPNGGLPRTLAERGDPIHTDYFMRHAGNNTVIVNGTSHGIQDGWGKNMHLWQNTTVNIAAEPKHLQEPTSKNFSFATQFLGDEVNKCDQQRTLSTIRTSATTAYYFDMFRSKSRSDNNFHDYIYHNIGDITQITGAAGNALAVSTTDRYNNDIGDLRKSPGWRFFENTEVTGPTTEAVKVRFNLNETNTYMNMFVPAGVEKEFTKAVGPPTREAKGSYLNKKTQVIAVRQQGEAWNLPFVQVFEPATSTSSSVVEVENLYNGDAIIGARVQSVVGDKTVEDHILCLPESDKSVTLAKYGISFSGRFAVVRYEQDSTNAYTTLYIGEGDSLIYGDFTLRADADRKGVMVKEGEPYFGRQLLFKNIHNKDLIPKGTTLEIEAIVGEDFTEVTLWGNDTINMGTKTEMPFVWSGHPLISNIQDDEYTFTLTAKDAQGEIEKKTIVFETPGQIPYPNSEVPHSIPGKIEFEEYDAGGKYLGYYDKTAQDPSFYSYRETDDVDLGRNGTIVSSLEAEEWLEYTVHVKQTGRYKLSVRHRTTVAPGVQGFSVILPNKGDTLLSNCETLYTGKSDFFVDPIGEFALEEGKQVLRFAILNTGFDLDYMELEFITPTSANQVTQDSKGFKVYPNPAGRFVSIQLQGFSAAQVSIYNMAGQLMYQKSTNNSLVRLPRESNYNPGMYLIRVLDENNRAFYKKFIFK